MLLFINSNCMTLKTLIYSISTVAIMLGCSSDKPKAHYNQNDTLITSERIMEEKKESQTGDGQGSGTGSLSGTNTGTPGTGNYAPSSEPEKSVGTGDRLVSPGTDADGKKPDTSVSGKWPARGNP